MYTYFTNKSLGELQKAFGESDIIDAISLFLGAERPGGVQLQEADGRGWDGGSVHSQCYRCRPLSTPCRVPGLSPWGGSARGGTPSRSPARPPGWRSG